jgi:lipopolysaccharide transport system permease protein
LNVVYRDVGYIVNSALVVLFWATPIVYPLEHLPEKAHRFMLLNPMASVLSCLRAIVMRGEFPSARLLGYATLGCFAVLGVGALLYRRFAREVADHV